MWNNEELPNFSSSALIFIILMHCHRFQVSTKTFSLHKFSPSNYLFKLLFYLYNKVYRIPNNPLYDCIKILQNTSIDLAQCDLAVPIERTICWMHNEVIIKLISADGNNL